MARGVQAADVIELSDSLIDAVRDASGRDWAAQAGAIEWDVEKTVEHLTASLGKYTLYLASRAPRYIPLTLIRMTADVTREDQLQGLAACARAFASTARAAPARTRAFHPAGMADVEGYVALACAHVMEHGHDIAQGLDAKFTPPADICAAVCARLYPWEPAGEDAWKTFLWIAGRIDLPGRLPVDDAMLPLLAPLTEWDGTLPRTPDFPVAAYVFDPGTSRWRPVEHPD